MLHSTRAWRRWLQRLGVTVGTLLGLSLVGVVWLSATAAGRSILLGRILPLVNDAIPGRLEVQTLSRLAPSGLSLEGLLILGPNQREVARLQSLEVDFSAFELLQGRVMVPRLTLHNGWVDLRQLGETREGLIAAFVDPDAPKSGESEAPTPYIHITAISVRGIDASLPAVAPLGELEVRGLSLDAEFELDATPRALVRQLSLHLDRNGERLAEVTQLSASLERGTTPSDAQLEAQVLGMQLAFSARGVAPPQARWQQEPLTATLEARGVSAARLAQLLNNPELAEAFDGDITLQTQAQGSASALHLTSKIDTAAGPLEVDTKLEDMVRASVELSARQLQPSALHKGIPPYRVGARLRASADLSDPKNIPLTLAVRNGTLDTLSLPSVDLSARVTPDALHDLKLSLQDGESRATVSGRVGVAGSAHVKLQLDARPATLAKWARFSGKAPGTSARLRAELDVDIRPDRELAVQGSVSGRQLTAPGIDVSSFDAELKLTGKPSRPAGRVRLSVAGARIGTQPIPHLQLNVDGGPQHYRVRFDGDFATLSSKGDLTVSPHQGRVEAQGEVTGSFRGRPWQLHVEPTSVGFNGDVQTEGIHLGLDEQQLHVQGRVTRERTELDFSSSRIQLEKLAPLLEWSEPLRGIVSVSGRVEGALERPRLTLRLSGEKLALGERPALDLQLDSQLDASAGSLTTQLGLAASEHRRGKSPLAVKLELTHQFDTDRFDSRGGWQQALLAGTLNAELTLQRVDSQFVAEWASIKELPVRGVVKGSVIARGTRDDPELSAQLESRASALGAALDVQTSLMLSDGELTLSATAKDQLGPWLALQAAMDVKETRGDQFLERMPQALLDRTWDLKLDLKERGMEQLPFTPLAKLKGMAAGAFIVLHHEPHTEPRGRVLVSARQTGTVTAYQDQDCGFARPRVELELALQGGQVQANLTAATGHQRLLESQFSVPVRLMPMLDGRAITPGPFSGTLKTTALELQTLPFLCGVVRGKVAADVRVADALGEHPQVDAALRAKEFSFGGSQTVNVEARAQLDAHSAGVQMAILSGARRSTLDASVPLELHAGHLVLKQDAPLSATLALDELPIAPFLDPKGAVSYASGTVAGRVEASGPIGKPRIQGRVRLKEMAFTATSVAQPLRGVNGTLRLSGQRLSIVGFEAHDRDGVLHLDGNVDFADPRRIAMDLGIRAEEFPIRQQGQVVATADLQASVATTLQPAQTHVTIDLASLDMWLESLDFRSGIALSQHPDFVVDGVSTPHPDAAPDESDIITAAGAGSTRSSSPDASDAAREQFKAMTQSTTPARTTALELVAKDGIWVKREDFAVNLSAALTSEITQDAARVSGRVDIRHGYAQIMGKVFDVEKGGYLEFVGTRRPDPAVNLTVAHSNRRTGQRVTLTITGRSSSPELSFRVDDQVVTAGKAFEALYGSQQTNESPNTAKDQAKGLVGGLTAGLMATTARRELGAAAPIIVIEPGEQSGEGRVRAGFDFDFLVPRFLQHIVTGVYFEGIADRSSGAAVNGQRDGRVQAAVLLELYFPMSFFTSGQYGPGNTWSADVGWQL